VDPPWNADGTGYASQSSILQSYSISIAHDLLGLYSYIEGFYVRTFGRSEARFEFDVTEEAVFTLNSFEVLDSWYDTADTSWLLEDASGNAVSLTGGTPSVTQTCDPPESWTPQIHCVTETSWTATATLAVGSYVLESNAFAYPLVPYSTSGNREPFDVLSYQWNLELFTVPEPASALLVGLTLVGLARRRSRLEHRPGLRPV
jgi:hypothetical protein